VQLLVQTLSAICILAPAAAVVKNACFYADGGRSLMRWTFFARGVLAMLSLAIKLCDVRTCALFLFCIAFILSVRERLGCRVHDRTRCWVLCTQRC
jgi:hypothetical protein